MKYNNVLLVLQGGGLRAIEVHCGVLHALNQLNIPISGIRGTSGGAIIGGLHYAGFRSGDIENLIRNTPPDVLYNKRWFFPFRSYFYDRTGTWNILRDAFKDRVFNDLKVAVTRESTQESYVVTGRLDTIMASSAIPVIFDRVYIRGCKDCPDGYYVDGGVKNNIPTPSVREVENYDLVIVSVCNEDVDIDRHKKSKIGRSLMWLDATSEREYTQLVNDWDGLDGVCILRPSPFPSSLLSWSHDYALIEHSRLNAYKELKRIL